MFAALPSGFPALDAAVEALGRFSIAAPPALDPIGLRMRKLYAAARADGYQHLGRGALRRLPYALWVEGEPPLSSTDPELIRAYWDQHLPEAVRDARAAKRWLVPLFYVYCHTFRKPDTDFQDFAHRIRLALTAASGPAAERFSRLHAEQRWFSPNEVGIYLGKTIAQGPGQVRDVLATLELWPGFVEEPICSEAFAGALRAPNDVLSQERVIERMKSWARADSGPKSAPMLRYGEHRVALADGLVKPWLQQKPADGIRHGLASFLIKHYGDPRMLTEVHAGHRWQGVAPATIATVRRWLVGDTLQGFMRLLQLTADEIWRHRERFWMAYYDHGAIEEAWLALGSQAAWHAQRAFSKADWAQYGALVSGATSDQSVLFLRIGQMIFMEWSHNGALRACAYTDADVPAMYLPEYRGEELRNVESYDFHNGQNQRPQLMHMNSEGGTWQRKARDFIAQHTGVRLSDKAIIG
ncbi:EH signature domain-containing protein [Roseateles sp. DC23W]|uniref:EH signature domain-containing protein n=1 Tax=Pelomonas dachongensis TaxID=3299029 RepID=A0ABW7EPQ2_9BURK